MMTILVDLFVLAWVLVALLWELPLLGRVLAPLAPLVRWLGFEQTWAMFAPDPPTADRELSVLLELPKGGALVWEPPRLYELSFSMAFLAFRYRSYEHAIVYEEEPPACLAALGDYLLGPHAGSEAPRTAVFTYVEREIPAPGAPETEVPPARLSFFVHGKSDEPDRSA
jgi:hypothetical protein